MKGIGGIGGMPIGVGPIGIPDVSAAEASKS
jgi:hypothetical protein